MGRVGTGGARTGPPRPRPAVAPCIVPPSPPDPLLEFIALFNRGAYWESHEVLERPWRRNRSDFYRGLILLASALVHAQRGNRHGIAAQLRKAIPLLERYRPHYLGLDVEAIVEHATAALTPQASLAPLRLVATTDRVRGDEPELRGDDPPVER